MSALSMDDSVMARPPDLATPSDLPAHTRIGYWLERLIVSRQITAGDKLPSEVEIARALGVSRMTLRQALGTLEGKGLLERRRGRYGGNFVAQPRFEFSLSGLPGFTEQMRSAHVEAGAHIVRATTRAAPEDVRSGLDLSRGDQVHEVIRVRSANGDPIAVEETYVPASVFEGLLDFDLTDSIYQIMEREFDHAPFAADEYVEPVKATAQHAELLSLERDDVLLLVTRISRSRDNLPIEYSRDYFRPDRTRIMLRTRADQGPARSVSHRR